MTSGAVSIGWPTEDNARRQNSPQTNSPITAVAESYSSLSASSSPTLPPDPLAYLPTARTPDLRGDVPTCTAMTVRRCGGGDREGDVAPRATSIA